MGLNFYMEVLILGIYFSTWFLLLYAVSYKVRCIGLNSPYKFPFAYAGETMTMVTPYGVIGCERVKATITKCFR